VLQLPIYCNRHYHGLDRLGNVTCMGAFMGNKSQIRTLLQVASLVLLVFGAFSAYQQSSYWSQSLLSAVVSSPYIIFGVVLFIVSLLLPAAASTSTSTPQAPSPAATDSRTADDALALAKRRLAAGEISGEEFDQIVSRLR